MSQNPELLVQRARSIYTAGYTQLQDYLGERIVSVMEAADNEDLRMTPDYITISPADDNERSQLNNQAVAMGREFHNKRDPMYEIPQLALPTSVLRIVEFDPNTDQSGGVDFAFGHEAFSKAKELIITKAPKYEIRSRVARNHREGSESVGYTYIKASNPDYEVTVTCLSTSYVNIVK